MGYTGGHPQYADHLERHNNDHRFLQLRWEQPAAERNDPGSIQAWFYGDNGNISSHITNGVVRYIYTNGKPNELSNLSVPSGTTTYGYDCYGNVTSIYSSTLGESRTLTYDAQERLVNVTNWDGSQIAITYNAQGLRASYTVTP